VRPGATGGRSGSKSENKLKEAGNWLKKKNYTSEYRKI